VLIYDADNKLQTRFFFLLWSTLKPRIGYYSCQKAHPIAEAYVKDSMTDHLSKWSQYTFNIIKSDKSAFLESLQNVFSLVLKKCAYLSVCLSVCLCIICLSESCLLKIGLRNILLRAWISNVNLKQQVLSFIRKVIRVFCNYILSPCLFNSLFIAAKQHSLMKVRQGMF